MLDFSHIQSILKTLPDPVFILTRSGLYAGVFGGIDTRYYHDGSDLIGKRMDEVLSAEKTAWFLGVIEQALAQPGLHVVEYGLSGRDVLGLPDEGPAREIWFEGRVQALDFPVNGEAAVLWVASNITTRHELELQLRWQSSTDPLTGLPNRRHMADVLREYLEVFLRYQTPLSVLLFDVDHFKSINDELGHDVGDRVLIAIADICRNELRHTDVSVRFGGDEFVILLPHTGAAQAAPLVERLRQRVADELRLLDGQPCSPTISGGLGELLATDTDAQQVLKRADAALYEAKRQGRNRIVLG
ncbi:diguanylate cyclase [Chitinilyticum litopenaei]|uniref:diguanylate cyclase n=1 Tax=Chitinilyticum litopenaei TaxID=1121276 RepID=UPI000415D7C1|nr:diguanylate cyclase [Chitinilyticum litopenaei]